MMLAAFPASGSQGETAALAYLFSVEDMSDYAVATAAKEFVKGTVNGHDPRFAPSTAVFAIRARLHENNAKRAVEFVAKHPEQLEQPDLPEAYRAEVMRRIAALPGLKRIGYSVGDPDGDRDVA